MTQFAARILDLTAHGVPMTPGTGSMDVLIEMFPAWRALPAGVGSGLEAASQEMESFMQSPVLTPANATPKIVNIAKGLIESSIKAATKGNVAAVGQTVGGLVTLVTTNIALTATWTAASAVPGGQPAANTAYTEGIKAAAAAAASAAFSAVAGLTDMHMCPIPCPIPPHGPGVVTQGAKDVVINNLPACRMNDKVVEACGGSAPITKAALNTIIGDKGPASGKKGGGAAGGAGAGDKAAKEQAKKQQEKYDAESAEAMLVQCGAIGAALVPCLQDDNTAEGPVADDETTGEEQEAEETCSRFELQVLDKDDGRPLPNVTLLITLPNGEQQRCTTDADGMVVIDDLEEPGACDVTCEIEGATNADTADFVRVG